MPAEHRSILVVDIEGFGRLPDDGVRQRLRDEMHRAVRYALRRSRLAVDHTEERRSQWSDTGDGVLYVVNAKYKGELVDSVTRIRARVRDYNKTEQPWAKLRLRIVIHAGEVTFDQHGVSGDDLNQAFRLLNSQPLRQHLHALDDGDVVLMVSDYIYDHVVRQGECDNFTPDDFDAVDVPTKEGRLRGWACSLVSDPEGHGVSPPTVPPEGDRTPPRWRSLLTATATTLTTVGHTLVTHMRRTVAALAGVFAVTLLIGVGVYGPPWESEPCPVPTELVVLASPSIAPAVERLAEDFVNDAEDYVDELDGPCRPANIQVFSTPTYSDAVENIGAGWGRDALKRFGAEPAVWVADATAATRPLERDLNGEQWKRLGSVATSPVVVAAERTLKLGLTPDATYMNWEGIWSLDAYEGAGRPQIVRAAPTSTAAAMLATVELFGLVTEERDRSEVEARIQPATEDDDVILCGMGLPPAGGGPPAPRGLLTSEQRLVARNDPNVPAACAPPDGAEPLTAIYPRNPDGATPVLDYPYVLLPAAYAYDERLRLAEAFHTYLLDDSAQEVLERMGFRGTDGTGSAGEAVGVDQRQPDRVLSQPDLATVNETANAWRAARPDARVLLAMDVSLSMNQAIRGEEGTRLSVAARDAAGQFVAQMSNRDSIWLWRFAENIARDPEGGLVPYVQVVPEDPDASASGAEVRAQVANRLEDLRPVPYGTDLYGTVAAGIDHLRQAGRLPDDVSAMLVVTDGGRGQDVDVGVNELLAVLDQRDQEQVLLFLLVLGPAGCDTEELAPLVQHPGVRCVDADSVGLPAAFAEIRSVMFGSEEGP